MIRHTFIVSSVCLVLTLASCSRGEKKIVIPNKVPLSQVTGTVLVDGEPRQNVYVSCIPLGDIAEKRPSFQRGFQGITQQDGSFAMSTYARGDGLPHGEYAVGFRLLEQKPSGETDLFEGRYTAQFGAKPYLKIKVVADEDLDLGEIDLKIPQTK